MKLLSIGVTTDKIAALYINIAEYGIYPNHRLA